MRVAKPMAMLFLLLLVGARGTRACGPLDAVTGLCTAACPDPACVLPGCRCWRRDCGGGLQPEVPYGYCGCPRGYGLAVDRSTGGCVALARSELSAVVLPPAAPNLRDSPREDAVDANGFRWTTWIWSFACLAVVCCSCILTEVV